MTSSLLAPPLFQSTRPVRGATSAPTIFPVSRTISIHAPRAGRDSRQSSGLELHAISIHAPRAGRDVEIGFLCWCWIISIHAPRAGRDLPCRLKLHAVKLFQSTRPVRGATWPTWASWWSAWNFNPRAPCGARRPEGLVRRKELEFQSTRPVRGATASEKRFTSALRYFNPRAPCGARRSPCSRASCTSDFNPRAPCGARRSGTSTSWRSKEISIHAPRAGRDRCRASSPLLCGNFNPRAPCGARQQKYTKLLYTLLRQKAILRQFHAKRRLLKRFSTYKYRNTFLICSANRMGKICTLPLRTTRSLDLPEGMSACSQSARFCFRTFFPSSKTADYPALDP